MAQLALSDSFEYLCYRSTVTINIFTFMVPGSTLDVRIWRLQTKVDPHAVKVDVSL